jgi:Bacterial SH3 domain
MKFCSVVLALILLAVSFSPPTKAEFLTPGLDAAMRLETNYGKGIEKVVFAKVQRHQILTVTDTKYSQEFAYFFQKLGFKRPPAAYLLYQDGNIAIINPEWQLNQPQTNLEQGVLFVLMVYDGVYDFEKFQNTLTEFKKNVLSKAVSLTSVDNIDDIEMRSFVLENSEDDAKVIFKEQEDPAQLRASLSDIDYANKTAPDLTVAEFILPTSSNPNTTISAQITLTNNSDFDYVFSSKNSLQLKFEKDSAFFVNNSWLNQRVALLIADGAIKARASKTYSFELASAILPGEVTEKIGVEFAGKSLASRDISIKTNDIGQKILRIKPTELNYLFVRQDPTPTSKEIGRASVGSVYVYTESKDNFYKITFNGQQGWVSSRYVDILK